MNKIKVVMVMLLFILTGCKEKTPVGLTVGVIQFGDFASLNDTLEGLENELKNEDITLVVKNAQAESANVVTIAAQFADDKVDLIVAITTQAAQAAVASSNGDIPVVFAAVSDPESAGVVGLDYVTGVSDAAPLEEQFDLIQALTPNIKSIGVLFKTGDPNGVFQTQRIVEVGERRGFVVKTRGAMEVSDLSITANALAQEVESFYLITDGLIVGNTAVIVEEARRSGAVSYASEDGQFENGILASNSIRYTDIGQQVGVMVRKILLEGISPKDIEIEVAKKTYPQISQEIADYFAIDIPANLKDNVTE